MKNTRPVEAGQIRQRFLDFTKEFIVLKECRHMYKIKYLECNTVTYRAKQHVEASVVIM